MHLTNLSYKDLFDFTIQDRNIKVFPIMSLLPHAIKVFRFSLFLLCSLIFYLKELS